MDNETTVHGRGAAVQQSCGGKKDSRPLVSFKSISGASPQERQAKSKARNEQRTGSQNQSDKGKPDRLLERIIRNKKDGRNQKMIAYLNKKDSHLAFRCEFCGYHIVRKRNLKSGKTKVVEGTFCGNWKLCPNCGASRRTRTVKRLSDMIERLRREKPTPKMFAGAFTIKSGSSLRKQKYKLNGALQRLRQRYKNSLRGTTKSELSKLTTLIFFIEITKTKNGKWHVHVHFIGIGREAPNKIKLGVEWHKVSRGSFIIELEQVYADCNARSSKQESEKNIQQKVRRIAEYCMKPSELAPANRYKVHLETKGMHFVRVWGKRIKGSDELEADDDTEPTELIESVLNMKTMNYETSVWSKQPQDGAEQSNQRPRPVPKPRRKENMALVGPSK